MISRSSALEPASSPGPTSAGEPSRRLSLEPSWSMAEEACAAESARLLRFLAAFIPLAIVFDVTYLVGAYLLSNTRLLWAGIVVLGLLTVCPWTVKSARAGRVAEGALVLGASLLGVAVAFVFILPEAFPTLVLICLLGLCLILPYASGRMLRSFALATLACCTLIISVGVLGPHDETVPEWLVRTIVLGSAVAGTGLVALVLLQFSSRLKENLAESRANAERFRSLVRVTAQIVWTTDASGVVVEDSQSWRRFTGQTYEQWKGSGWLDALHPDDRERMKEAWQAAVAGKRDVEVEYRLRRADGTYAPVLTRATPLVDAEGRVVEWVGYNQDITERKEHEERSRLGQELLARRAAQLALSAEIGAVLAKEERLPAMLQRCAEAIQRHMAAAFARIWLLDERENVLVLEASAGQYTHLDGAHSRVPLGRFKIGRIASERSPLMSNDVANDPHVGDRAWAQREGMVSFAGYPLLVDGKVVGVVAFFARHPLTEETFAAFGAMADMISTGVQRKRAEAERERLILALQQSNRELDQFAYVASHDLKAPLRGISILSEWVEEDLGPDIGEQAKEHLRLLRGRVHRMEALIEGILDYSRAGRIRHKPERVDVERVLAETTELLAPPAGARIEVAPGMPVIETERVPLQQVLMNLIGNALKHAARSDPHVRVEVREDQAAEAYVFTVTDNGPGIARQFHERIWGIFQTLEPRDKVEGTGIGLAVVKKIVESRGGRVWVDSEPERGARFSFSWPKRESGEAS